MKIPINTFLFYIKGDSYCVFFENPNEEVEFLLDRLLIFYVFIKKR